MTDKAARTLVFRILCGLVGSSTAIESVAAGDPAAPESRPSRQATAVGVSCEKLAALALPDTTIFTAEAVAAGRFVTPRQSGGIAVPVAFCRVTGAIRPTADSDIRFELWLPQSGWSGRYESVGNGGFAGAIRYDSMLNPLLGGSAVASTDDGHRGPAVGPGSATWALGHPEKIADFGYRAVHLTALAGKAITQAYYGRAPRYAYFVGCSKGGQEGFMEAQRYPADFDGILSGAAANQWTDLFSSFAWMADRNTRDRGGYLSIADLDKIGQAVRRECDAVDGVADGLISTPLECKVDLASVGLTPQQFVTYAAIHGGPVAAAGRRIYAGFPFGAEDVEWKRTVAGPSFDAAQGQVETGMYGSQFFANFVYQDPAWSFQNFDLEKGSADARRTMGAVMNSDDVSFAGFKARGGRLIQWNGLADGIVTALGGVSYYHKVIAAQSGTTPAPVGEQPDAAAAATTNPFYRLFLAPGVGHCGGGPGPNAFGQAGGNGDAEHDMVVALQQWVEKRVAPTRIVATKYILKDSARTVAMTRPLCAYPQVARYTGSGDPNEAANFTCLIPGRAAKPG